MRTTKLRFEPLFLLIFTITTINAQLTCELRTSCSAAETAIVSMTEGQNAHLGNSTSYINKLCCSGITGLTVEYSSDPENDFLISLSDSINAHAKILPGAYDLFLTSDEGPLECVLEPACQKTRQCVLEVSDTANAHIGVCNDIYPYKVCCDLYRSPITIKNLGLTGIELVNPEYTSQRSVYLVLIYYDSPTGCRYINKNSHPSMDDDWTPWEDCISGRLWELSEGAGLKRVWYQVNYSSYIETHNDTIYYNYTGAGLDLTPPFPPRIIDGDYTNQNKSITIRWEGAYDPESLILGIPLGYNYVLHLSDGTILDSLRTTSTIVTSTGFDLPHNTTVYVNLTVINSAGLTANISSDGLIVDLVKPFMTRVNGSFRNESSGLYQATITNWANARTINFSWMGQDNLSDVDAYSYIISKTPTNPDNVPEGNIGNFASEIAKIYTGLSSGTYYFAVKARDLANNWGDPETKTIRIDSTPSSRPLIILEEKQGNDLRYEWSAAEDPESGVSLYMVNLTENDVVRYSATTANTFHVFPDVVTGNYNATVGAKNGVGIWRWSFEDEYSMDTTPPEIIATPNGTINFGVDTSLPIIRAWTNEQAVCYYNSTIGLSRFSYSNTTYHETKSAGYAFNITCIDMAGNHNFVEIAFQIDTGLTPDDIDAPTHIEYYQGQLLTLDIHVNDTLTKVAGVEAFRLEVNNDPIFFDAFDLGTGTYRVSFYLPEEPGTYTMSLLINSYEVPILLDVQPLFLNAHYYGSFGNPSAGVHMTYYESMGSRTGIAGRGNPLASTDTFTVSGISTEESAYIFNTRTGTDIALKDKEFENMFKKANPSFGYSMEDKYIIDLKLNPEYEIQSYTGDSLSKGRHEFKIVRSQTRDGIIIKFLKGGDDKLILTSG